MIIKINNKLLLLLLQHFCSYLVVFNYLNEENPSYYLFTTLFLL